MGSPIRCVEAKVLWVFRRIALYRSVLSLSVTEGKNIFHFRAYRTHPSILPRFWEVSQYIEEEEGGPNGLALYDFKCASKNARMRRRASRAEPS